MSLPLEIWILTYKAFYYYFKDICKQQKRSIHSSDMSIIQKFLTNQTVANEIIIVITPYCPTPQPLLHIQEGVNLLSLKIFDISKCLGYLNFLWNYSQMHYSDVRWCTSKWTLGHRRKKRGGGYNTSSPIILYFLYQAWQENYIFRQYSLYKLDKECIETNCRSMCLHCMYTRTVYRRINQIFWNKQRIHLFECCY